MPGADISVAEIAARFGVARSTLYRAVLKNFGTNRLAGLKQLCVNICTQLPGGPFPLPTRAVRESVHASAATIRPIARGAGGCRYGIDLHPTGCTVMRGTN